MAKPRLGQHFLADRSYLKAILEAAELSLRDAVIEVGPGKGVLTQALVRSAGKVLALEVDERLVGRVTEKLAAAQNLEVRHQDARRVDWPQLAASLRAEGWDHVKLVANLPYYLASQMVIHALAAPALERLVVMVQEEVARRMCAAPGGKDYSAFSVAVQFYGSPRFVARVPPKAFRPPPRVSSAIVCIDRRERPPVDVKDADYFFFIVHGMFTHRRKTIRRCLAGLSDMPDAARWENALAQAGIDAQRRPETLSLQELAALVNALT